jgi:hypothetical protein
MGVLDPLFRAIDQAFNSLDNAFEFITNPQIDDEQASDAIGGAIEDVVVADEAAAAVVDAIEEAVIDDLEDIGQIDPGDAEDLADGVEGGSVATILGLGLTGTAIEAASLGQVDQHQEYLMQAVASLQLDNVTGTELQARMAEGVEPALLARVTAQHRAKFADLQDAVEYALRNKQADSDYLSGNELPDEIASDLRPDEPVTEDNLIEQYGIRDDQLRILEEVAIREMEPEELLETPTEAGVFVDPELLQEEMDRTGVSEQVKDVFTRTAERLPRTTRAYEERPVAEAGVAQLDQLVSAGEVSPDQAIEILPDLNDKTIEELRARFELISGLPNGSPTRSQVEGGFTNGLIGLERFTDLVDQVDVDPEAHPYVLQEAILSELDGALRRAVGLGLIGEGQYVEYAEVVGLEQSIIDRLLQGEDLDDIADSRLSQQVGQGTLAVDTISGIGESRRDTLEAVGIDTVSAVANSSPDEITSVLNVAESTAEGFISRATRLSGNNS